MDTKKVFSFSGFPNHLISDEDKADDTFGLQMAKAIEKEWFYRKGDKNCSFYDKRDKYHQLRLYARGEQDVKIYKDLLNGGDKSSYANYDWRPLQVIPKFVKLVVNQMSERLFDIKAEAVDKFSTDLKDRHRKIMERFILGKPAMLAAKKYMDVDILPDGMDDYPDTQEELDLYMKLKYKPAIEIAAEEALKYTLELNDYDEIQSRVIEDITTIGIGGVKHTTDPSKGIIIEGIDPADMVYSYPKHKNFKGVHYYGEVVKMTISELERISGSEFTKDELKEISESSQNWVQYHGNLQDSFDEDNLSTNMVNVLFFNFKSTNTVTYKKKYLKNGGYKMTKKESTYSKKNPDYKGYDVEKRTIDVWYEGALVLGTNRLFNYKLCENMVRPEGNLNIALPNYILYAPELYQNRSKSLVERIIPYVDQMQQIHIKIQQMIAKARPNGIYIDVAGLNEVDMGDGSILTPLEAVKMYDETGNVVATSVTDEGTYNYGREPIKELKNGIIDGLDRLIGAYNHYLTLLRDAIGIPQGADASMPHPDTLVGVQQQVALNSNTATRHILDGALNISKDLGKGLSLRLKDIFMYSDLKEVYINAIGQINVDVLEAIKNYSLFDLGINIDLKPDLQEKQYLENNIQNALSKGLITFDDAVDIRSIGNIKLANELLKTRRIRREKQLKQDEMDKIEANGRVQIQSAQEAAKLKAQELEMKMRADLAVVNAKSKAKERELEKEAEVKSNLMAQEFEYNMSLAGLNAKVLMGGKKYENDRKDQRQDKAKTQESQLIDQRQKNSIPKNFESSEDNLSGSVELSELEPN